MFDSLGTIGAALLALQQIVIPFGAAPKVEKPRAPIETAGPAWAAACKDFDEWGKPAPPVRIHGNTYLVGTCGISAILITGTGGHILIDSGPQAGAAIVADNIRALGFRPQDVRFLLFSHEHFDHVGGIAELQRLTGATLISSAAAQKVMDTGADSADDPQAGMHAPFPAAKVGRVVADGEEIRLGNLMVEAIATPGHTSGAMSWRWVACDGGVCRRIVYADSMTPVSRKDYRFSDHPAKLAAFRQSIAKIAASPCDIVISPHPSSSKMRDRFLAAKPLLDTDGCKTYAADVAKRLDDRLAEEAKTKK